MGNTSVGDSNPLLTTANPVVGVGHAAVKTLAEKDGAEKALKTSLIPGYVVYDVFTNGQDSLVGRLATNLYNNTPLSILTSDKESSIPDNHALLTLANPVFGVGHAAVKTLAEDDGAEKALKTAMIPGYGIYDLITNGSDSLAGKLVGNLINNTPLGMLFG